MRINPTAGPRAATRRAGRRGIAATFAVLILMPIGAAQAQAPLGAHVPTTPAHQPAAFKGPPPVHVASDTVDLATHPFGSCWSTGHSGVCYDGPSPNPPPSLGAVTGPVRLAFPRDGWHFRVSLVDSLGHRTSVHLVTLGARSWRLALHAIPDGAYDLDIFGKGPQGDVVAAAALTLRR